MSEQRMAQVHDDYIGQILDFGEDRRFAYVVYPLYRPGSLARYRKEIGAGRTLKWCAQIIYQILSGLMTASELGLVHLDLKPGNIVLDGQYPRIIDWGLSRTWNASEPGDLVVRGTPFYAGPERIVSPHAARATPLTDLYGLGATFY